MVKVCVCNFGCFGVWAGLRFLAGGSVRAGSDVCGSWSAMIKKLFVSLMHGINLSQHLEVLQF